MRAIVTGFAVSQALFAVAFIQVDYRVSAVVAILLCGVFAGIREVTK